MSPAACVIGWPVEHSRSPLIHNYWLKAYGVAGTYGREAVAPDQFQDFLQSLAARFSVALPYSINITSRVTNQAEKFRCSRSIKQHL